MYLIYADISECQMRLQDIESLLIILLRFCKFCTQLTNIHVWSALSSLNINKLRIWCKNRHFIIIKCQMGLQVMEHSLILRRSLRIYTYIIEDHSCLKYYIFTKFSQIVCLTNTDILICWHARCNHKLRNVLEINWVLWKFQCLIR